ncbi:MAG: universal stress protein [Bacteroidota bacterium]
MKKIIVAFDSLKFSETAMNYAIHYAKLINAHLVGVFLDDSAYTSYKIYDLVTTEGSSVKKMHEYDEQDKATRARSATTFENACRIAGLNHSIHHDRNVAIQELLHESIYADLVIISRKETLTHYEEDIPTTFVREFLTDVQCPVIIVPEKYAPVEKLIILYDGEPSSVHAVKMYNYIFTIPEYNTTEVVYVKSIDDTSHMADNRLMKEFMKKHFPATLYKVLKGFPEQEIVAYLKEQKKNSMIVLGAYRRGRVSRWFRPSMADILMKEINAPLFIAHNK